MRAFGRPLNNEISCLITHLIRGLWIPLSYDLRQGVARLRDNEDLYRAAVEDLEDLL